MATAYMCQEAPGKRQEPYLPICFIEKVESSPLILDSPLLSGVGFAAIATARAVASNALFINWEWSHGSHTRRKELELERFKKYIKIEKRLK